jgi:hypothetical protein
MYGNLAGRARLRRLRTDKAIADERWDRFPHLRQVLEGREFPAAPGEWLSTSTSEFERLGSLDKVRSLASHHKAALINAAVVIGPESAYGMARELLDLRDLLFSAAESIRARGAELSRLADEVAFAKPD